MGYKLLPAIFSPMEILATFLLKKVDNSNQTIVVNA